MLSILDVRSNFFFRDKTTLFLFTSEPFKNKSYFWKYCKEFFQNIDIDNGRELKFL
jgi:hypothetical protein